MRSGVNDASRFAGAGVDFKAKLIGVEDVEEARGDKMCQIAMAKLKAGVKASREHKPRINVNVSLDGIKVVDEKTSVSIHRRHLRTDFTYTWTALRFFLRCSFFPVLVIVISFFFSFSISGFLSLP